MPGSELQGLTDLQEAPVRSASSTTLSRRSEGRHRLGLPGLVPVSTFVEVTRPSFFTRWFRRGRHRSVGAAAGYAKVSPTLGTVTALPTPVSSGVRGAELTAA